jgi:hypothetical protein
MRDLIDKLNQLMNEDPADVRDAIQQRVEKIPNETDLFDILK